MCEDDELVGGVAVVIVECPSEADTVEGAVDVVLWRKDTEGLNESKALRDIVWGDGGMLCKVEEEYEFGNPNNRAKVGSCTQRRERGNTLGFGRVEGR